MNSAICGDVAQSEIIGLIDISGVVASPEIKLFIGCSGELVDNVPLFQVDSGIGNCVGIFLYICTPTSMTMGVVWSGAADTCIGRKQAARQRVAKRLNKCFGRFFIGISSN